jgi:hypothetical protein
MKDLSSFVLPLALSASHFIPLHSAIAQLTETETSSKSVNCGLLIEGMVNQGTCKVRQEPFIVNGQPGMIVYVTFFEHSKIGKYPSMSDYGINRWRYFYAQDCTGGESRVPIKTGYESLFIWSNGWLACPSEGGALWRKIIYNEALEPLFWVPNIFF